MTHADDIKTFRQYQRLIGMVPAGSLIALNVQGMTDLARHHVLSRVANDPTWVTYETDYTLYRVPSDGGVVRGTGSLRRVLERTPVGSIIRLSGLPALTRQAHQLFRAYVQVGVLVKTDHDMYRITEVSNVVP